MQHGRFANGNYHADHEVRSFMINPGRASFIRCTCGWQHSANAGSECDAAFTKHRSEVERKP